MRNYMSADLKKNEQLITMITAYNSLGSTSLIGKHTLAILTAFMIFFLLFLDSLLASPYFYLLINFYLCSSGRSVQRLLQFSLRIFLMRIHSLSKQVLNCESILIKKKKSNKTEKEKTVFVQIDLSQGMQKISI